MSDAPPPSKIFAAGWVHFCEHPGCTEWGAFGHGHPAGTIHWYCKEHDPDHGLGAAGKGWRAPSTIGKP
ncbi:hypothetical protein FFK22_037080 [Mycobacterium sp. KBS0706]|nr:hypothetical protein FFK22_037080 [Mycobacterium sp. KBS0706]